MQLSINRKEETATSFNPCNYDKLLALYIDNNLSKVDGLKIQSHLETCKKCKTKSNGLKNAQKYLKESIPKNLISEDSLGLIETEVTELISIKTKILDQKAKKNKPKLMSSLAQVGKSAQFLRVCFFGALLFCFIRYFK